MLVVYHSIGISNKARFSQEYSNSPWKTKTVTKPEHLATLPPWSIHMEETKMCQSTQKDLDSAEDRINNSVSSTLSTAGSGYATCFYNVPECNISVWGCVCMCVRKTERVWVYMKLKTIFIQKYSLRVLFVGTSELHKNRIPHIQKKKKWSPWKLILR